jgi:regulator of sigma E protease
MTIVYGLFCLGFIIFFHELGHFTAARIFGVRVESFSIGMGPVLFHKKYGTTDYRLSLFPLGGYCGLKGEKDFSLALEQGEKTISAEKDSLFGIHPFKRIILAFAGPFFNIFFAFVAFSTVAMTGYTYYSATPRITLADEIYPDLHSAARDAGLRTGDVILTINGNQIHDFSDIAMIVSSHPDENLKITADRNGTVINFVVHTDMDTSTGTGKIGVSTVPDSVKAYEAKRYPFFPAFIQGVQQTGTMLALTVRSIGVLFKGVDITNTVAGPARITTMLGDTVKQGFSAGIRTGVSSLLQFMAVISISLFLMNLLPIPVLDGGMILVAFLELLLKRQIPPKTQYYIQFIGIAFIAVIFFIGLSGDIRYFSTILRAK